MLTADQLRALPPGSIVATRGGRRYIKGSPNSWHTLINEHAPDNEPTASAAGPFDFAIDRTLAEFGVTCVSVPTLTYFVRDRRAGQYTILSLDVFDLLEPDAQADYLRRVRGYMLHGATNADAVREFLEAHP